MEDPEHGLFDAIYFDTFEEGYRDRLEFIGHLRRLLKGPRARFLFFHGHGGKKETIHEIYIEVLTVCTNGLGFRTEWIDVFIDPHKVREGFIEEQMRVLLSLLR